MTSLSFETELKRGNLVLSFQTFIMSFVGKV
ncbi:hypothetical protein PSJ8397_02238 [Pseudooctadecabacter jejudonensis]|uniref:Uncharacterized protein n=1 Tax=Pseudooctadecabacter jejudonensis TaxID=1391910 RepID=A0A1Y5SP89_9RHOB|nr:hypothetical protein PSJ8397_02238 [Pseudooctadecabacter jejudonensis]